MNGHFTNLNGIQREAAEHAGGPLLITAGAGSGKTRTLTSRLLYLLNSGIKPEQIIAITFTNKAAKEMRIRITNNKKVAGYQLLVNSLFIGTFHSLGAKILKKEAGCFNRTSAFTIFDENDSLEMIKNILKEAKRECLQDLMDVENTKNVLKDQLQENRANLTLDIITQSVAKDLNIKPSEIRSKGRSKNLVYARRIAIYLCRELTQNTMPQLAQYFGMQDHTAISHTLKKINELINDRVYTIKIREL